MYGGRNKLSKVDINWSWVYEADYEFLSDKYDQKKSGRINYRAFSEALENGEGRGD